MNTDVCGDCGNALPLSGGSCPYCMILDAESRLIEERGAEISIEYIDDNGKACVRLPPDVGQIRRTTTWLFLLSTSMASLLLVHLLIIRSSAVVDRRFADPESLLEHLVPEPPTDLALEIKETGKAGALTRASQ